MNQYRHGDLLIQQVQAIPDGATRLKHCILAQGTATGHAHMVDKKAHLFEAGGRMYVEIKRAKSAALTHDEHARIDLPRGAYEVIRQREYAPERNVMVLD